MKVQKEMSPKNVVSLVCGIFWFVSVIMIVVGIFSFKFYDIKGRKCTEEVEATVVRNETSYETYKTTKHRKSETLMYRPVYEYEYNGKTYVQSSNSSSSKKQFERGDKVLLRIDPDDPEEFFCPSDKTTSILGYIFVGIGIFMILFSIMIYAIIRKTSGDSWNGSENGETDYTQLPEYTGEQ